MNFLRNIFEKKDRTAPADAEAFKEAQDRHRETIAKVSQETSAVLDELVRSMKGPQPVRRSKKVPS